MFSGKNSRKGLSPLLAIIIGLIVTIVAGILLAQLYFSYAATISARPAANIEYNDLVVSSNTKILAINIKNTGNVRITGLTVSNTTNCENLNVDIEPGETYGLSCKPDFDVTAGSSYSFTLNVTFADGSTQIYAIVARARSA